MDRTSEMKVYVSLKTPKSVTNKRVKDEIRRCIRNGKKTSQIAWKMEFVTTPELGKKISDKFQVLKNRIAFEERSK